MSHAEICFLLLIGVASFGMSYLGAAVGLVLGHFRVVLITYVLGSAAAGAATSMAISTVSTLVGAVGHARGGRVQIAPLIFVGGPSALSAYLAARYSDRVDPTLLKLMIAVTLLVAAAELLWRGRASAKAPVATPLSTHSRFFIGVVEMLVGTVLGAISGLIGLLLGSVRLPAMVRLGINPATAVGTNMAIGAMTGFFAGMSAMLGGKVNLTAFAVVAPLSLLGSHLGAKMTGKLNAATLRRWIGYALLVTAGIMLCDSIIARSSKGHAQTATAEPGHAAPEPQALAR